VPRVGVCDNFFELGGDSILSIQVVSLARREGFGMTPRLLFDNQTVRELAAAAGAAAERSPEEPVGGEVPLTPVQEWFFRQDPEEPHHYNQAFMFEVARRLDASVLERALEVVGHHHDGFRLRYRRDPAGWRQFYSETAGQVRLERVRTPETSSMESAAARAEASLDIGAGPLGRAVYFESPNGEGDHLLLVVHHLVVDGVSWRILLEDLETAYRLIEAGEPVRLPEKTTSFGEWSRRLSALAASPALGSELGYWREVTDPAGVPDPDSGGSPGPPDTESAAQTLGVSLEPDLTQALLRRVPAAYHTGINDVLLAGLARAWSRWSGSEVLFANLEGHGREDLEGTDLSRTSGWFTSIFPVRLQLEGASGADWQPGEVLKRSKEHLGRVPGRGIGYGILRYLGDGADFSDRAEPSILVNYLGQLDALTAGSSLFRLSGGPTGPWHSPKQRRRYPLELNCQIRNGRLETAWTYSPSRHPRAAIEPLAAGFIEALGEIVAHCDAVGAGVGETSDFPLAGLDQEGVARLYAMGDVEDIYPLSPIQKLFHSSAPDPDYLGFDQWSSTLRGALDESAFRQAWEGTLARHPVLRSSIHSDGLPEPVQVVHGDPRPVWTVLDWRGMSPGEQASSWSGFLEADRARPLNLTEAPLMRFGLIRLAEERWKFVWSVPALLLDGWSWPLVFGDAGGLYDALVRSVPPALEPARPYRHYIEWLGRQSFGDSEAFWRRTLAGFREPTHLPLGAPDPETGGDRYVPLTMTLSEEATSGLASTARALRVTVPVLVQGAWALLVSRRSGDEDVCYGAAFAGRPADLYGVEGIVGPFVNNLPVRVALDPVVPLGQFLRGLHARLLELSTHQFMPMVDIQAASEVPWRHRLFESLVVFQNYRVGEAGRSFGGGIGIGEFAGPIHTNYRVLLLADPGDALALTLIYDRRSASGEVAEAWGRDLTALLERLPGALDARVGEVRAGMSPGAAPAPAPAAAAAGARGVGHLAPRTEMERVIAGVWQTLLGIERIGVDANVFDIGGSSLLLVRAHGGICEALGRRFPVVTLFEYPTVQSLARHLGGSPDDRGRTGQELRDRAERQRGALARIRAASEE
jgi:non-ribosomal peptide synthase protein (TIGR01720 family)